MKKRNKVKNRGLKFLIIIIAVACIFTVKQKCIADKALEVKEITVSSNQTLWNIAQEVCEKNEKLNIQNVIIDIKELNSLESSKIYIGQTIYIPQY